MPNLKPGESQCNTAVSAQVAEILDRWVVLNYKKRQVLEASVLLFDAVPSWVRDMALGGESSVLDEWAAGLPAPDAESERRRQKKRVRAARKVARSLAKSQQDPPPSRRTGA